MLVSMLQSVQPILMDGVFSTSFHISIVVKTAANLSSVLLILALEGQVYFIVLQFLQHGGHIFVRQQ